MKNENIKLFAVLALILVMIVFATVSAFLNKPAFNVAEEIATEAKTEIEELEPTEEVETEIIENKESEPVGQETEEIVEADKFDGIMLCDLDGDGNPEKFDLTVDEYLCTASMNGVSFELCDIYMDDVNYGNYFTGSPNFVALVQHKITDRRALMCSMAGGYYDDIFNIVTLDGEKLTVTDSSASTFPMDTDSFKVRDIVLKDYIFLDEKVYISIQSTDFDKAMAEYNKLNIPVTYSNAEEGTVPCYLRRFDIDTRELEYIPLPVITYDEYIKAKEAGYYTLDGINYTLGYEPNDWGAPDAYLLSENGEKYWFYEPWEDYPVSIIEYGKRNPVKVKMSDNFKVRYGVTGYDENGIASGFDENGNVINKGAIENRASYTAEEYFNNYCSLNFTGDNYITIKNGEAVYFDDWYHD